jgi:hypothetical protein
LLRAGLRKFMNKIPRAATLLGVFVSTRLLATSISLLAVPLFSTGVTSKILFLISRTATTMTLGTTSTSLDLKESQRQRMNGVELIVEHGGARKLGLLPILWTTLMHM